jgi:beta-glucosidase
MIASTLIVDHSAGKLPVSFPKSVATAPAFYNYFKGGRSIDPGAIYSNGSLLFGHQVGVLRVHGLLF